jgi:hypothetical protein
LVKLAGAGASAASATAARRPGTTHIAIKPLTNNRTVRNLDTNTHPAFQSQE